jgi:hypothetical protein
MRGVGWGGVVGSYPLLSHAPTHVEVELGCDKKRKKEEQAGADLCQAQFKVELAKPTS